MVKKKSLEWQNCSEEQLSANIQQWLKKTSLENTILFLEGEMGAGKSTFVRSLLENLAPEVRSQGSPTFPLIQEYETDQGVPLYHLDLFRLKSASELLDSGLEEQIEAPGAIVCIEWASLFESEFAYWLDTSKKRPKSVVTVQIALGRELTTRNYSLRYL